MNETDITGQRCLTDLAQLYDYPQSDYIDMVLANCERLSKQCSAQAASVLAAFCDELSHREIDTLEEIHTRTFALSPVCVPYVGVQLFGENNFKRGEFLGGLSVMCNKHAVDVTPELPDHIASMLYLAAHVAKDELDEMLTYCMCPATDTMTKGTERLTTPYRFLVKATNIILKDMQTRIHHG